MTATAEASSRRAQPRRTLCPRCGVEVVIAQTRRGELTLDRDELLPRMRCECKRRHRKGCQRCENGWVGHELPSGPWALLRSDGYCRLERHRHRRPGDACHALHTCGEAAS
jgi:hypothetical protein